VQTHELASSLGLKVISPDEIGALDIAIDGADEVDPAFNLTKGGGAAHTREKIVASIPVRRLGRAEEIGSICGWLSSDDAGFTTGAEISCNGGLHMG
jgi:NAD(P)-dependent dehydrogenase (short-subunit alcohol dehydrogenase family)